MKGEGREKTGERKREGRTEEEREERRGRGGEGGEEKGRE